MAAPAAAPSDSARPPRTSGGLAQFIALRVVYGIIVLFLVSIVVFVSTAALGDPAKAILGRESADPNALAAMRDQLNIHGSLLSQYWTWFWHLVQGNPGTSYASHGPVSSLIGTKIANSAFFVFVCGVISIPVSVLIGAYAALKRDKTFDVSSSLVTLLLAAMPEFVLGIILVVVFSTTIFSGFLPAIATPGKHPWEDLKAMMLPVATLVLAVTPYVARIMRASMVEVLESDYVEMARLKGMPEGLVMRRHALPNALGPAFQVIAINLAYLAGGIIVVEYIFNINGIGGGLRDAVFNHDVPVVQALAMLIAAVYVVLNLIADIATIIVTPRLRTRL